MLLLSALGLAGCERTAGTTRDGGRLQDDRPAGEPIRPVSRDTVIDGDTVTLHAHEASAFDAAPQWTLDPVPLYTAGDPADGDGSHDVEWALDVRLLPDGRLVALKSVNGNVVLVIDARGRGQHRWGRTGQGPGDLMRPTGLLVGAGDTLLVPDDANARLNVLLPDHGLVSSRPVPQYRDEAGPTNDVLGITPDGSLLVSILDFRRMLRGAPSITDSITRQPILLRRVGLDGTAPNSRHFRGPSARCRSSATVACVAGSRHTSCSAGRRMPR